MQIEHKPEIHHHQNKIFMILGSVSVAALIFVVGMMANIAGAPVQPATIPAAFESGPAELYSLTLFPRDSEEIEFATPVPIAWSGRIMAVVAGGDGYAVRLDTLWEGHTRFLAFWPEEKEIQTLSEPSGNVTIRGMWTGTTCAYRNTLFAGTCVPEIAIESIESFN